MKLFTRRRSTIRPGQVRELHRLGMTSTYRVVDLADGLVRVEVIKSPALETGQQLRLTAAAVEAMRLICERSIEEEER